MLDDISIVMVEKSVAFYLRLQSTTMASLAPRRLAKELKDLNQDGPPAGCQILSADNFEEWRFQLSVLGKRSASSQILSR